MTAQRASAGGDFLASVVDRAQERAPLVAPRPTSLFEPVTAPQSPAPAVDTADAPAHADQSTASPDVRVQAMPRNTADRSAFAPAFAPVLRPAGNTEGAAITAHERAVPAAAYDRRDETPRLREVSIRTIERDGASPRPRVAREAAAAIADAAPKARVPADLADDNPALPRGRNEAHAREAMPAEPARASLLPDRAMAAAFVPLQTPERGNTSAAAHAASPPSVTISIGRVEVRAASPSAQPAAAAKVARRPMRLDEYLARKEPAR